MLNISEHVCLIENEEDLVQNVEAAKDLLEYAKAEGEKDDMQWSFENGYLNTARHTVTAVFKGHRGSKSNGCLLSVVARRNNEGEWICKTEKKEIPS